MHIVNYGKILDSILVIGQILMVLVFYHILSVSALFADYKNYSDLF
jgi:hypothetical protein